MSAHSHPCTLCGDPVACNGNWDFDTDGVFYCDEYHSPHIDGYVLCEPCEREERALDHQDDEND